MADDEFSYSSHVQTLSDILCVFNKRIPHLILYANSGTLYLVVPVTV